MCQQPRAWQGAVHKSVIPFGFFSLWSYLDLLFAQAQQSVSSKFFEWPTWSLPKSGDLLHWPPCEPDIGISEVKNHHYRYHLPLKISCSAGTQPVTHKYCLSGYSVLALPDTSKLFMLSGFWCAFILKGFSLFFNPLGDSFIYFFFPTLSSFPFLMGISVLFSGICIIPVVENCSFAKVNHSE